ncbi:MAG: thiamine-phosphate kinase [Bacteroidota bacterium]
MSTSFSTIQNLGAKGLLSKVQQYDAFKHASVHQSIGDDAAVLVKNDESFQLISSDIFVEGVDFDLVYTPLQHLGYKIVSSAVSDIYAMNGTPETLLVNLALPNRVSVEMITDLYEGIFSAGKEFEVELVGGDLKANHQHLVLSVTVTGSVSKPDIVYRKTANQGDALCVTGDLGAALAGLRILMREKSVWEQSNEQELAQPDLSGYEFVVKRQLVPQARKDIIEAFREHSVVPTSMIDITKGLLQEVTSICEASHTGAYLYQAALPIAIETRQVADEMEEDVDRYALFGGEDLELLFTLPESEVERLAGKLQDFSVVGRLVPQEEGLAMQTAEGEIVDFDELS